MQAEPKDRFSKLKEVKSEIEAIEKTFHSRFLSGEDTAADFTKKLSLLAEIQMCTFADFYLDDAKNEIPNKVSIVFTGGNGRDEVFPGSDTDFIVLVPKRVPRGFQENYGQMIQDMWDMGYRPERIVRTAQETVDLALKEAKEKDYEQIWTTQLSSRHIWGNPLSAKDQRQGLDSLNESEADVWLPLVMNSRQKHMTQKTNSDRIVPNVKRGMGGTADYHLAINIGQVVFGYGGLEDFVKNETITEAEATRIEEAYRFLIDVRCHLNLLPDNNYTSTKNTECNKMHVSLQRQLAEKINVKTSKTGEGKKVSAVEAFMAEYQKHSREIEGFLHIVNEAAKKAIEHRKAQTPNLRSKIFGFACPEEVEQKIRPLDFEGDDQGINETFSLFPQAQQEGRNIHVNALRTMRNDIDVREMAAQSSGIKRQFIEILTAPEDASGVLRAMRDGEILHRLFPAFGHIDGLRTFHPYHASTIDEHSFDSVDMVRRLAAGELEDEAKLASDRIKGFSEEDKRALAVAAFIHDWGKGYAEEHEIKGAEIAKDVCDALELNEKEAETVCWLVRNHLLIRDNALHRFPDDETVEALCTDGESGLIVRNSDGHIDKEGSRRRLDLLTAMTTADIMAVGPNRWTPLKSKYVANLHDRIKNYIDEGKAKGYELLDLPDTKGKTVHVTNEFNHNATYVTVHANDRPGLFRDLVVTLTACRPDTGCKIVEVCADTIDLGGVPTAVNSFAIQSADGRQISEKQHAAIELAINEVLKTGDISRHEQTLETNTKCTRASANDYGLETEVSFDNDGSRNDSIISVKSIDRQGYLAHLTSAFNELNEGHTRISFRHARINTYGNALHDVFYLRAYDVGGEKEGRKLTVHEFREVEAGILNTPAFRTLRAAA